MKKDLVLTSLAFKRYMEAKVNKTATKDGFVGSNFTSGEVLGLEEESVQVSKRSRWR